jgi:hypothetical protein
MKIQRLRELKQKLIEEKDLSKIWLFFMNHFADHQAFTNLGEPAHYDYLDAVLQATCQQIFGNVTEAIKITNFA